VSAVSALGGEVSSSFAPSGDLRVSLKQTEMALSIRKYRNSYLLSKRGSLDSLGLEVNGHGA
jgi:hypothetical protein